MRRSLLALALLAANVSAQQAPAPLNTHQVNPDRTVTFRYLNPGTTSVAVDIDWLNKPLPLEKTPQGLWTVTTPPLPPEIYSYAINVDGRPTFDNGNLRVIPSFVYHNNELEVPADTPQLWDLAAVPHGQLHTHLYTSKVILGLPQNQEPYIVYTPPGYDPRAAATYPVLYLLHGWSNTEAGWTTYLQANVILDNLLAAGKIKPMVVVMPLGYGDMSFLSTYGVWNRADLIDHNTSLFSQALLTEILPQVESTYRVSRDRTQRAIAGLSMGGLESLSIGLANTAKFAWIGGFSSAVHQLPTPVLDPKIADLRLLWIACGVDDSLIAPNRKLAAALKSQGLPVTSIETPGAHVSQVWRDNLIHFAPLLFQSK